MSLLRRLILGLPALWLLLFFLAPFALVARISLSRPAIAQPSQSTSGRGASAQRAGDNEGRLRVAASTNRPITSRLRIRYGKRR
jgi:ABC-type spermidine/putrescine transport system permease subunit I